MTTNKKIEYDCLSEVTNHCQNGDDFERHIAEILSSESAIPESESPDFVYWINGREGKTVLGVEHFSVHHFSEKYNSKQYKNNETFATDQYSIDYKLKNYNLQDGVIIPSGEERIITSAVEKTTVNMFKAEYTLLCRALEKNLNNHIQKNDSYRKNIRDKLGEDIDIKMAFIIDISTEFDGRIAYDGKEGQKITKNFVPMFRGIVDILSGIDNRKVDYIFIRFNKLGTMNEHDIVVLRTNNIEQQLAEKNIPVYEYVGVDFQMSTKAPDISTKCHATCDCCNKKIIGRVNCSVENMSCFYTDVYKAYMWAMHYKKNGIRFVTTIPVCMLIEAFDGILDGSKWINRKQLQCIYERNREIVDSRCEVLKRKLEIDDKKCDLMIMY